MGHGQPEPRVRVRRELIGALVGVAVLASVVIVAGLQDLRIAVIAALLIMSGAVAGVAQLNSQRRELERLVRLYASLQEVANATDVLSVLGTVAREAAGALLAKDCVVMYRHADDLVVYSSAGASVTPTATPLGRSAFSDEPAHQLPSVRAILTGVPIEIADVSAYDGPPGFHEACAAVGVRAVLCMPIAAPSGPIAALNLGFETPRGFSDGDRRLAQAFADQASAGLQRALAYEREREAVERLQALDDMKSDFLSTVSHELRTPLTGITGFGSTLLERWDIMDDELRLDFLRRMKRAADELDRLLGDLIDLNRLEREPPVTLAPLDLGVEIARVAGRMQPVTSAHSVTIDVPAGTTVLADARTCGRVLSNLIANAAKFSPEHSSIAISIEDRTGEVVVAVADEGEGIAQDEQARIFDRFYRVPRQTRSPRGSGMGLTIVKQCVESMGGTVWVNSEPGHGATFFFTLRKAPRSAATRSRDPAVG